MYKCVISTQRRYCEKIYREVTTAIWGLANRIIRHTGEYEEIDCGPTSLKKTPEVEKHASCNQWVKSDQHTEGSIGVLKSQLQEGGK